MYFYESAIVIFASTDACSTVTAFGSNVATIDIDFSILVIVSAANTCSVLAAVGGNRTTKDAYATSAAFLSATNTGSFVAAVGSNATSVDSNVNIDSIIIALADTGTAVLTVSFNLTVPNGDALHATLTVTTADAGSIVMGRLRIDGATVNDKVTTNNFVIATVGGVAVSYRTIVARTAQLTRPSILSVDGEMLRVVDVDALLELRITAV